ncbi:hypothetical protein G4G27_16905 [Sphingomonas sp. So64.6b]|nr:hypothetical protein G4G27_16905 [Sphingomonas sp. So64.6b]
MLVGCVLFVKGVVPSGFMPLATSQGMVIQICTGMAPQGAATTIPGTPTPHDGHKAKIESPCAFAGLGMPWLFGAEPLLLAIEISLVIVMGFRKVRPLALFPTHHLRPPVRGPPARACLPPMA